METSRIDRQMGTTRARRSIAVSLPNCGTDSCGGDRLQSATAAGIAV